MIGRLLSRSDPSGASAEEIAQARGGVASARAVRLLVEAGADWLSPPVCMLCEAPTAERGGLCAACFAQAVMLDGAVCPRCGALSSSDPVADALSAEAAPRRRGATARCAECPDRAVAFDAARAVMAYEGHGRTLALLLKRGDRLDLAPTMGRWMARAGAVFLRGDGPPPVVAPAPSHWTRRWSRGGDHAAALAQGVAAAWSAPFAPDALRRLRATSLQTRLSADARWGNVAAAFGPGRGAEAVRGRRVVLVDDVMTTGATLDAAARALLDAGATGVDALVFARPCRVGPF